MIGHDPIDPSPGEVARGLEALRELGVEPLPADVLARLDGRLEGALGRPAPVRRRRRLPRLAIAMPGVGVALGVAVVVAVLGTNGGGTTPQQQSALSKSAAPQLQERATAGGAAGDSSARSAAPAPSTFATKGVEVPALVGHGLPYVRSRIRASGLKWAFVRGNRCLPLPTVRVRSQLPKAGATVPAGSTIRVSIGTCIRYDSG